MGRKAFARLGSALAVVAMLATAAFGGAGMRVFACSEMGPQLDCCCPGHHKYAAENVGTAGGDCCCEVRAIGGADGAALTSSRNEFTVLPILAEIPNAVDALTAPCSRSVASSGVARDLVPRSIPILLQKQSFLN